MSDLVRRAYLIAEKAHSGQVRKYTGEPYISHPQAVCDNVKSVSHTEEMLAAALLHDVVEDTPTSIADIEAEFGTCVASLVEQLTDVSRKEDGNRAVRKAIDREHLAKASAEAKTIKLADLIDNSLSIIRHDTGFAKVYMKEKKELLSVLKEGDKTLWENANWIIEKYFREEE